MISVTEAEARILAGVTPVATEVVPLGAAAGRVLAADLLARHSHPPRDISAMDGYAVGQADIAALPASLNVAMRIQAGDTPPRPLQPGEAARIFTGAPLPEGADSLVIQENTTAEGNAVTITEGVALGRFIRRAGYDFREGDVLARCGTRLTAAHLGVAAAAGHGALDVYRRPRVAILSTGNELVPPGATPQGAQIIASAGLALTAQLADWGADALDLGIARDDEEAIRAAVRPGLGADILITIGGASVGDADLVKPALVPLGLEVDFWKIAMRPGKPLMFGHIGPTAVLGLPGNPVSALICAILFVRPLLAVLAGESWSGQHLVEAIAGIDIAANDSRQDYLRARLERENDALVATPYPLQDSGNLSTFARANALILRAPDAPKISTGAPVQVLLLGGFP